MKYLLFIILLSPRLLSQEIVMPIERKIELSYNSSNYENYIFKDINNVFEKFLGKWLFKDSFYEINLKIFKYFDKDNRQDAIFVNMRVIKGNDTLINTLPFTKENYISGGVFENKKNLNKTTVFFSEITEIWSCGNQCNVDLTYNNNELMWDIEDKKLRFNKTTRLFPNHLKLIKQ